MTYPKRQKRNTIKPDILIQAYKQGYFPMAEHKEGDVYWHCPDPRAIIPLDNVKKQKSLKQSERKYDFRYSVNKNFEAVIRECSNREDTWISDEIIESYIELHKLGYAQSVETNIEGELVGGLYGVSIGGAFFGESMFNDVTDASKAAFYYLTEHLKRRNFILLDTQYINPFTEQLGAVEIPYLEYMKILMKAINLQTSFLD